MISAYMLLPTQDTPTKSQHTLTHIKHTHENTHRETMHIRPPQALGYVTQRDTFQDREEQLSAENRNVA